jgi:hypothetical protein
MSVEPRDEARAQEREEAARIQSALADGGDGQAAPDQDAKGKGKGKDKKGKAKEPKVKTPPEPAIVGETAFDRVSSALVAFVTLALALVTWVGLLVYSQQTFAEAPLPPVEIIEVEGGGGGTPDGDMGATLAVNVSGADAAAAASNNMEDASAFEEPSIEMTSAAVIDALSDAAPEDMAQVDIAEALPNAGFAATGKRASKIGTGKPFGYGGTGTGGGVPRQQRWSIVFNPGQTTEEYARQLDFLKIELATIEGPNTLVYAGNFTSSRPNKHSGLAAADKRLYFLWQGAGRKSADVQLLGRAGIQVGNKAVFQFIPKPLEDELAQIEYRFKNRQPIKIRKTQFQVVKEGERYVVKVLSQEPMAEGL